MSQHVAILINGEIKFASDVEHFDFEHAEEVGGPHGIVMLRLTYAKEAIR